MLVVSEGAGEELNCLRSPLGGLVGGSQNTLGLDGLFDRRTGPMVYLPADSLRMFYCDILISKRQQYFTT